MCPPNERVALVTPDVRRKSTCCSRYPCCREAITIEFGPGALRVLSDSQAWFRERVRRFLEEGADPAF